MNKKILDWLGTMSSSYKTMLDKTNHQFVQITLTRQMAKEFVANVDELQKEINRLYKIEQAILETQELEKELADVEKVKSGKIIIYFGKDLVMMNKNKYYDYLELEKEPISKRILQAKCEELEKENTELNQHIKRWHDLLLKTGINSKGTVVDEIENYWQIKVEAKNER